MAGFSDYLENALLDHAFAVSAYTPAGTVYAALYTAAPTDAGGGTECSGTGYARQAISFAAASTGTVVNDAIVNFGTAGSAWGTVSNFGVFDAASAGNLLAWEALTASKTIGEDDPVSFPVGQLSIALD